MRVISKVFLNPMYYARENEKMIRSSGGPSSHCQEEPHALGFGYPGGCCVRYEFPIYQTSGLEDWLDVLFGVSPTVSYCGPLEGEMMARIML
jgi:hypothetical protein